MGAREYIDALERKCELQGKLIDALKKDNSDYEKLVNCYEALVKMMEDLDAVKQAYIDFLREELDKHVG